MVMSASWRLLSVLVATCDSRAVSPIVQSLNQISADGSRLESFGTTIQESLAQELSCEIESSGPICLGDGEQHLLPAATQPGLVGLWNFDEEAPLDTSGNKNHGTTAVIPAPAPTGAGNSAAFVKAAEQTAQPFLTIPDSTNLELQDFTYTFWIYLLQDSGGVPNTGLKWCPVVRKGVHNPATQEFAAAPAILLDRATSKLRVALTTSVVGSEGGEVLDSNARLNRRQWYHLAVVRLDGEKRTRLYVNGILDATASTQGYVQPNTSPLYVGGDPWVSDQCLVPMYVDELRVFNRPLSPDEIQAEAAPALAGIEPSFVRLACLLCPLEVAMSNCPQGYHVCNSLELHMGGYMVARSMGWLDQGTHVWTHATVSNAALVSTGSTPPSALLQRGAESAPANGLGLCCADSTS